MEKVWERDMELGSHRLELKTLVDLGGGEEDHPGTRRRGGRHLDDDQLDAAAAAFRYLVTSDNSKIALTAAGLSEFSELSESVLQPTLDHLEEERILRSVAEPERRTRGPRPDLRPGRRYELFHDLLGEAVRDWRKRHEAERERAALLRKREEEEQRRLEKAAAEHKEERMRIVRRAAYALSGLVVLLIAAVVWALYERGVAESERQTAQSRALAAAAIGRLADRPRAQPAARARGMGDRRHRAGRRGAPPSRGRLPRPGPGTARAGRPRRRLQGWAPRRDRRAAQRLALEARRPPSAGEPLQRQDARHVELVGRRQRRRAPGRGRQGAGAPGASGRGGRGPARRGPDVFALSLSSDGRFAAGLDSKARLGVWNARTGRRLAKLRTADPPSYLAFAPGDPHRLVGARCYGDTLWSWRWPAGAVRTVRAPGWKDVENTDPSAACLVAVSPSGERAVETLLTGSARLWDLDHGRLVDGRLGSRDTVSDVEWSPQGQRLATAGGKVATVFDGQTGRQIARASGHGDWTNSVAFSPDGSLIATSSSDATARVWGATSGALAEELRGHGDAVLDAAFTDAGRRLVTVSTDGTAREWAAPAGERLAGDNGWVLDADMCSDSKRVATVTVDGVGRIWTLGTSRSVKVAPGLIASRTLSSVDFDADCKRVVTAGDDASNTGQILVADAKTGRNKDEFFPDEPVIQAEFSPDGKWLVTTAIWGKTELWRVSEPYDAAASLPVPENGWAITAEYSPSGKSIVTAGVDGIARIFDVATRKERVQYRPPGTLRGATFSGDGRKVLSFGSDGAQIWDARTGRQLVLLRGSTGSLSSGAFSPDGTRVVTGGADQMTRVWEARTGRLLSMQRMHGDLVNSVKFSPDGRLILSAADDDTARVYACETCMSTDAVDDLAGKRVFRTFTSEERNTLLDRH